MGDLQIADETSHIFKMIFINIKQKQMNMKEEQANNQKLPKDFQQPMKIKWSNPSRSLLFP